MTVYNLRQSISIRTAEVVLRTSRPLIFENAKCLRGFVGRSFSEEILLHQHSDKDFLYSYPRVQYKVVNKEAKIIALAEGVDAVKSILDFDSILLDNEIIKLDGVDLSETSSTWGLQNNRDDYEFLTPWLALNEKNYNRYKSLKNSADRKTMLEKILIGNIISISKSLGYTVPGPIKADFISFREVSSTLKGTPMIGFLGKFSLNFSIPDYWGLGKSVSRGFGVIVRKGGSH